MNNPLSADPEHALFPSPSGCTGWRLWRMLHERTGASKTQYLRAFDRRNLLNRRTWQTTDARSAACRFLTQDCGRIPAGTTIVVLGAETARALGLDAPLVDPTGDMSLTWRRLPHPSGRNLWFNNPNNKLVASLLLEELYERSRQSWKS